MIQSKSEQLEELIQSAIAMVAVERRVSFFPKISYPAPSRDAPFEIKNCMPIDATEKARVIFESLLKKTDKISIYNYKWNDEHLALHNQYWNDLKKRVENATVKHGRTVQFKDGLNLIDGFECFWFGSNLPVGLLNSCPIIEYENGVGNIKNVLEMSAGPAFVSGGRSSFSSVIKRARSISDSGRTAIIWWGQHFEIYAPLAELERITRDCFQWCYRPARSTEKWISQKGDGDNTDI